jgi:hypothetical protein
MATPTSEPILLFARRLNALGLPYMVTGGVAALLYGEPRLTLDVDVVMVLPRDEISRLAQAFPADDFYCPPLEVLAAEAARPQRGHFNLIHHHTAARADVYLASEDALDRWAFERVRTLDVEGETVRVAPPEYVIVRKLEYYREGGSEKHVRDVRAMLRVSAGDVDTAAVTQWAAQRGLGEIWTRIAAG